MVLIFRVNAIKLKKEQKRKRRSLQSQYSSTCKQFSKRREPSQPWTRVLDNVHPSQAFHISGIFWLPRPCWVCGFGFGSFCRPNPFVLKLRGSLVFVQITYRLFSGCNPNLEKKLCFVEKEKNVVYGVGR